MEKTGKKIISGSIIVLLIASIGVVFASANNDDKTGIDMSQKMLCGRQYSDRQIPFDYNLTDEQKTELKELINTLKEQSANSSEIRNAIQQKLDEWGILDKQLDNEITQAQQILQILNREKELRNQGYSWNDIKSIIQEEFNIQNYKVYDYGMMNKHGFDREPFRGQCDFKFNK